MAEQTPFGGLFNQFGIDERSQEEILAERRRENFQQARANTAMPQFKSAAEQSMFDVGRTAGSALGQAKMFGGRPQLSGLEAQRAEAVKNVNATMKGMVGTPEWEALGPEEKQDQMQRTLAAELSKAGDVSTGVNIFANLKQKEVARQARAAELRKLEATTSSAETKADADAFDLLKDRRGQHVDVYRKGTLTPMAAFIDPVTGAAKLGDGTEIPRGEYSFGPDRRPSDAGPTRGGTGKPFVTPSQAGEYRNQVTAIRRQIQGAIVLKKAMQSAIDENGSINMMGAAGSIMSVAEKSLDAFGAISRELSKVWGDQGLPPAEKAGISDGDFAGRNFGNKATAQQYASANRRELDSIMKAQGKWDFLPESIRQQAGAREQFYAALSQMAYAQALINEPGARQLSDADFKNAMAALAGASSNPETLRQVLLSNIERSIDSFWMNMDGLEGVVDIDKVVGRPAREGLMSEYAEFQTLFGKNFGTAAEVGEGLTGEAEAENDLGDGFTFEIN